MSVFWLLALVAVILGLIVALADVAILFAPLVWFVLAIALLLLGGGAPGWAVLGRRAPDGR